MTKTEKPFSVEFKDITQNLGRAEFDFCTVVKRGRIVALRVFARQQERKDKEWVVELPKGCKFKVVWFSAYGGLKEPNVWRSYVCEEHKGISYEVYVPSGSNQLEVDFCFGNTIHIQFHRRGAE